MCNSGYFLSYVNGLDTSDARSFLASTNARFYKELDRAMLNKRRFYSQIRCSVPPNIATLPSILQCSCANCSEQVAQELASCNCINFNKFVDFNIFLADFR